MRRINQFDLIRIEDLTTLFTTFVERPDFSIKHYLEVKFTQLSESGGRHYRTRNPQFECSSADIAEQVVLLVDHARTLDEERQHTVSSAVTSDDTNS